ncbi:MAG: hypothetical protein K2P93_00355 [Alphaproteobacteria bacterium]|nr:hypothetical protein [Alphaproteobacteria bacterium]
MLNDLLNLIFSQGKKLLGDVSSLFPSLTSNDSVEPSDPFSDHSEYFLFSDRMLSFSFLGWLLFLWISLG